VIIWDGELADFADGHVGDDSFDRVFPLIGVLGIKPGPKFVVFPYAKKERVSRV
jgi:hypothetical protein